ncbi:hypothetical protein [Rhizobium rhizogenes]|uniref:hypothetical protein n=1 Tax=Rhizobium rhizogenes TaxID=359 RepID=UPI00115ED205|nr:hypothetical protein [Rhizobium rhizogenes]TRB19689.1 hypothetical protein EXN70_27690 [Rhizobium rhizogenes]
MIVIRGGKLKGMLGGVLVCFTLNVAIFVGLMVFHFTPFAKPIWWADVFAVAVNLIAGGLVSFFFYWLVVYLPEQRKRRVIKDNLMQMYRAIKESILYQVVFASVKGGRTDLDPDLEAIEKLMTPEGFKEAFAGGREAEEGFYAFLNQMKDETPEFREILKNLEMLARQIEFVLHNYTMDNKELFDFFKRLELLLLSLRRSVPGYDESRPLCGFVYEIFAGWSNIEGYRGYDIIEKMIADI